jgi:hypothetical protein
MAASGRWDRIDLLHVDVDQHEEKEQRRKNKQWKVGSSQLCVSSAPPGHHWGTGILVLPGPAPVVDEAPPIPRVTLQV